MKIIATLTVNPTIDKNTSVEQVRANRKLRCQRPRREPGGGGLNVSRAILRLGGRSRALYLRGGPTGEILEKLLDNEGLDQFPISCQGWTRENIHVQEESSEDQYRFGMPGPEISEEEWRRLLKEVSQLDPSPDYLVASGSLPPGIPDDFYGRLTRVAADLDARLIVDTSGAPLRAAVEAGAFLIKPNISEFQELVGEELGDEAQMIQAGRELLEKSDSEIILVSLGRGGALLITSEEDRRFGSPTVPIRSKIGAGDSMVAGAVLAMARGENLLNTLRFAIAAGAAAVMTKGTELCRRDDAENLFQKLKEKEKEKEKEN